MEVEKYNNYTIAKLDLSDKEIYNGDQIQPLYSFKRYGVLSNSILIFRGGMRLTPNEMIDIKDIRRESHLADVLISSDDTLHFIIEEFDVQPPNIELMYYRLRIFAVVVSDILREKGVNVKRAITDLYIDHKKLNVGIASVGLNSGKIHFGINIVDTGAPSYVKCIGLKNVGINEDNLNELADVIAKRYIDEINAVKNDIAKTKTLVDRK